MIPGEDSLTPSLREPRGPAPRYAGGATTKSSGRSSGHREHKSGQARQTLRCPLQGPTAKQLCRVLGGSADPRKGTWWRWGWGGGVRDRGLVVLGSTVKKTRGFEQRLE